MTKQRPVNLDLGSIRQYSSRFPLTAIASILHRITGVAMFFGIGILLLLLGNALSSPDGFNAAAKLIDNFLVGLVIWAMLTALAYHFCSGIRHLIMDMGIGENLAAGERSARIAFACTALLSLLAGGLVW